MIGRKVKKPLGCAFMCHSVYKCEDGCLLPTDGFKLLKEMPLRSFQTKIYSPKSPIFYSSSHSFLVIYFMMAIETKECWALGVV